MRASSPRPRKVPSRVSPRLLSLLEAEPLATATALDVGTGQGALALALAPRCRRVIGIDRDAGGHRRGPAPRPRSPARDNVEFVVADAEVDEYAPFAPDLVVAHLCMSDAIVERASRALAPGQPCWPSSRFHADQWRETGRRSRFAYDEAQMPSLLDAHRLRRWSPWRSTARCSDFASVEEGLAAAVGLEERWRADGRWFHYIKFLEEGGRTLTRAHLVVKARRR